MEAPAQVNWAGVRMNLRSSSYTDDDEDVVPLEFWRWTKDQEVIVEADSDGILFAARQEDLWDLLDEKLGSPAGTTRIEVYQYDRNARRRWNRYNAHWKYTGPKPDNGDFLVMKTPQFLEKYDDGTWCPLPTAVDLAELAAELKQGDVVRLSDHQCGLIDAAPEFKAYRDVALDAGFVLRHGRIVEENSGYHPHRARRESYVRYDPLKAAREQTREYVPPSQAVRRPPIHELEPLRTALVKYLDEKFSWRVNRELKRFGSFELKVKGHDAYVRGDVMESLPKLIALARRVSGQRWDYLKADSDPDRRYRYSGDSYSFCRQILKLEPVVRLYRKNGSSTEKNFAEFLEAEIPAIRAWQKRETRRRHKEAKRREENEKTLLLFSHQKGFWNEETQSFGEFAQATRYKKEDEGKIKHPPEEQGYAYEIDLNSTYIKTWKKTEPEN